MPRGIAWPRPILASPGTTTPAINEQSWTPTTRSTPTSVSFWEFMTLEEISGTWRSKTSGLRGETPLNYWRHLQQIYHEIGEPFESDALHAPNEPPHEKIFQWGGTGTNRAKRVNYQKALRWWYAWKGYTKRNWPEFLETTWDNLDFRHRAIAEGTIELNDRHLTVEEFRTLLASRPFETKLRTTGSWNGKKRRRNAEHKDDTYQFMIGFGATTVPRPSEWKSLRVEDLDIENRKVLRWDQDKKAGKRRTFTTPEDTPWTADKRVYPSVKWFIDNIRPGNNTPGPMLLQLNGEAYAAPAQLLREGMNLVLGPDAPSAHALRRFGATEAWAAGWTESAICRLLDDDWSSVKRSYIDWDRVGDVDRGRPASERPPRQIYRPNGNNQLYRLKQEKRGPVLAASSQVKSWVRSDSNQTAEENQRTEPRKTRPVPRKTQPQAPDETSEAPLPFDPNHPATAPNRGAPA